MSNTYLQVNIKTHSQEQKASVIANSFANFNLYGATELGLNESEVDALFPEANIISQDLEYFNTERLEERALIKYGNNLLSVQLNPKDKQSYLDFLKEEMVTVLNYEIKEIDNDFFEGE